MKTDIRDILFWIFLILGIILLIWTVFGKSPSEFIALVVLIFTVLLKVWKISDRQIRLEMRFRALARDFKEHTKHK